MVDALTFYKDLNELAAETEFEDADVFCGHLNAFLEDWSHRMQTEVLHTDKLESRLEYLENEVARIKQLKE